MLLTVGHGTTQQDEFAERLLDAEVAALVDVRIGPGSRRNPQFGRPELERWLPERGIAYRWDKRLGGFRKLADDSPDVGLRNDSFRAYAGYMRTENFAEAVADLVAQARAERTAIMCGESVWWRCHRRLIADHAVLLDDLAVEHLMPDGRRTPHPVTDAARVAGRELIYDQVPGQPSAADPG
ncbi:DUF488 domain-containing protein [Saxibacter everestensis]|uniref:DUF488 domain-containing protein n=1 Tax=Saxibacter everestensis TaxID=2909229 RepID=A0ABY8QZY3_9MICO|nr:DUF488 domain-containing protein [Brevibacteriaceae bacterium ZFBP1038]